VNETIMFSDLAAVERKGPPDDAPCRAFNIRRLQTQKNVTRAKSAWSKSDDIVWKNMTVLALQRYLVNDGRALAAQLKDTGREVC
jgi:hypothetical protein